MKDDKHIKDPFLKAMKRRAPEVQCTMVWFKNHQKLISKDLEEIRRQGNQEADKHAGIAARNDEVYTMPYLLPEVYILRNTHTKRVVPYKKVTRPTAPWDTQAVKTQTMAARLEAAHKKTKHLAAILFPLLYDTWTVRVLWHEEFKLPSCSKKLNVGARHKCPCQYEAWQRAFQKSAPHNWTMRIHKQDITIYCGQQMIGVMGNKTTLHTHSWAGVPLYRDLHVQDHHLAPIWGETVRNYYAEAQVQRWG